MKRVKPEIDPETIWRPNPSLIGPVMSPMIAWQRAGEPGWPWEWNGKPAFVFEKRNDQLELALNAS
jgi:hypothetical protein